MKKNILTMAALLMASAAVFTACSSDDNIIENNLPADTGKQAYTLTVSASKGGSTTRALTDNDGAIEASWQRQPTSSTSPRQTAQKSER